MRSANYLQGTVLDAPKHASVSLILIADLRRSRSGSDPADVEGAQVRGALELMSSFAAGGRAGTWTWAWAF